MGGVRVRTRAMIRQWLIRILSAMAHGMFIVSGVLGKWMIRIVKAPPVVQPITRVTQNGCSNNSTSGVTDFGDERSRDSRELLATSGDPCAQEKAPGGGRDHRVS